MQKFMLSDLPKEKISCEQKDLRTAYLLKKSFVGTHGELNSALKFARYFYDLSKKQKNLEAEFMLSIAIDEIKHLEKLGKLLVFLGLDIVYMKYPPVDYLLNKNTYEKYSFRKIIFDGITTKLTSINCYEKILCETINKKAQSVVKKILDDENKHLSMLKKLI